MNRIKQNFLHKIVTLIILSLTIIGSIALTSAYAQQRLELDGTSIIGNKELPNVLTIVPWKSIEKVDLPSPPIVSIMDQALTPIERDTFQRQVRYHQAIFPVAGTQQ
jgi:hypothetical protein